MGPQEERSAEALLPLHLQRRQRPLAPAARRLLRGPGAALGHMLCLRPGLNDAGQQGRVQEAPRGGRGTQKATGPWDSVGSCPRAASHGELQAWPDHTLGSRAQPPQPVSQAPRAPGEGYQSLESGVQGRSVGAVVKDQILVGRARAGRAFKHGLAMTVEGVHGQGLSPKFPRLFSWVLTHSSSMLTSRRSSTWARACCRGRWGVSPESWTEVTHTPPRPPVKLLLLAASLEQVAGVSLPHPC